MNHRQRRSRVRTAIAREAARAMYWEGVGQYFDAKRIGARRVLGSEARSVKYRPRDLPSNGEIQEAVLELARFAEGADRTDRLFAMRLEALDLMAELATYQPRLIGSVWSGHARRGSDIDLHVFIDDPDALELDLWQRGWTFEPEQVLIRVGSEFRTFRHVHVLGRPFPVELSVYAVRERRTTQRSSTDGRPIDRVSRSRLLERVQADHEDLWTAFLADGVVPWEESELPAAFDGLLAELAESDGV